MKLQKTISDYYHDFLHYCEIDKGLSPHSIMAYQRSIEVFIKHCANQDIHYPKFITRDTLLSFRKELKDKGTMNKRSQNNHIVNVRVFLKYLHSQNIETLDYQEIETKFFYREIKVISQEDIHKIANAIIQKGETLTTLRDRALFEFLYCTGLRVSEASRINVSDIDLANLQLKVVGKGNKERIVFISDEALLWLRKYLDCREDNSPALFIATTRNTKDRNKRMTPRSIQRRIKKAADSAQVESIVTPHILRHSFATHLLENGANIKVVQQLLGHTSLRSTQWYTHVTNKKMEMEHRRYHRKNKKIS
jgi:site-specific recombinase XerD